ncbi:MAG: single-stranded-DNA-specific exonuclease RecJ [Faecalibacterium sp.]|nr:single-stranded-DNA-specific exonuclease RecJ [Ruminococcus sp.]MCM1391414.1 single-stranded-DNA-specific exonuclease RecJ [Ruminococcus sp.]MCM1485088.1 single-stranded-DNA-specific exonuclease RecJ [Faecalibacterium sp.]
MSRKKWCVSSVDKDKASEISANFGIDPFSALLLVSRGMTEQEQIEDFFAKDYVFSDPFEIKDMDKAVERILSAIDNGEKIAVYGDYDADGVTATSILYLFLEIIGANVIAYIPDRNTEGYGLNNGAIDRLYEQGVNLIVTVDNGISAINEAEHISELGMDLVVTDHHKVGAKLPKAVAVVDPHRKDCPSQFKELAGVGVAFKLICALSDGEYEEALDSFADIISIGTIGDVVSLTGENRALVKYGLRKLNGGGNCGLDTLRTSCINSGKRLNATSVAFSIVPRINAVGRVDKASDAFRLLISDSVDDAMQICEKIEAANAERQRLEQIIMADAEKQLEDNPDCIYDRVLVFDGLDWHGGVIGIVAARFVDRYGKPCIVITSDGENAKGSGRSIEGFSLYDAINSCSQILTHFGGHTLAAGFGLKSVDIDTFRKAVNDYAKTVEMPFAKTEVDCRLRPNFISADILPIIDSLEPFGAGNPQPIFGLFSMKLLAVQPIGAGKHIRLTLSRNDTNITALKFGTSIDNFPYHKDDVLDLAVRLEKNEYMGEVKVSIYIKDIRMSGTDDEKYLYSVRLYEKIKRGDRILRTEAADALPDRKFVADVYRFICANGGWNFDSDVLCYRLGGDGSNACKVLISIDVLAELGIFAKNGEKITIANTSIKVNLDDSKLLKYLKNLI